VDQRHCLDRRGEVGEGVDDFRGEIDFGDPWIGEAVDSSLSISFPSVVGTSCDVSRYSSWEERLMTRRTSQCP